MWLIIGVVLGALIAGIWLWRRGASVPRPDLAGADAELVGAIDAAEQEVRREPRSAQKWGELGLMLMTHGYWSEAERCFQRAGDIDEASWLWPYFRGVSAQWIAPEQAIESLQTAVTRDGAAKAPRLLLGELLAMQGQAASAQQQFEAVLKDRPDHARAQLGLARAMFDQDQWAASLAAIKEAATHPSTRKAAAEFRAQALLRLGDAAAAQEALTAAQKLPRDAPWPEDPLDDQRVRQIGKQAALKRVAKLKEAGAHDQAQAVVQATEERHVDLYWLVEGRLRLNRGDAAGAEVALREALKLDPGSIEILLSLAQALAQLGRAAEAEETLRDLLAREPAYGPAWLALGRSLQPHDPQKALAALRSATRYMPRSAEAHAKLADALIVEGQDADAARHRALSEQLRKAEPPATGVPPS